MKIVVIGTGYVGLVSGVCFAEIGHEVICIDKDSRKAGCISRGESPIYEDGLDGLLGKNLANGRLRVMTNLSEAMIDADVSMICVGTPFDGKNIDLSYVKVAASEVGKAMCNLSRYHVVCVKSTVVPGTTDNVVGPIVAEFSNLEPGVDWGLVMNPEFLAEGTAVKNFMSPDRIVIGANDTRAANVIQCLYESFDNTEIILTTNSTAEMIKYTANAFLA